MRAVSAKNNAYIVRTVCTGGNLILPDYVRHTLSFEPKFAIQARVSALSYVQH